MLITLENIQRHLSAKGHPFQLQNETNQLFTLINQSLPFFIRLYEHGELLQFIAFFPHKIKEGQAGELALLLHHINKDIDMPGFGMDETKGVIFYRWMLPIHKLHIEEELIDMVMDVIPNICQAFSNPILTVAQGKETYRNVLRNINRFKQSMT